LINKLDNKVKKYQMKIGTIKVDFECDDDIFKQTEKTCKINSDLCSSCQTPLKEKNAKKKTFCDFCGSRTCEKCLYKKREFLDLQK